MRFRLPKFHFANPLLLGMLFIGAFVPCLQAETGDQLRLPEPTRPGAKKLPSSGLILQVDTRWVDASGYRPVKITILTKNSKPTAGDRLLYVQFQSYNYYNRNRGSNPVVGQYIELPQGATSVSANMLVPQSSMWNQYRITSYEDGREIKELSKLHSPTQYRGYEPWTEAYPSIIYLDSDLPSRDARSVWANKLRNAIEKDGAVNPIVDLRVLCNETNTNVNNNMINQLRNSKNSIDILEQIYLFNRFDLLNLNDLPDQWLALSSIDLIFISKADLEKTSTQKREVLFKWLNAGGNLCVTEIGKGNAGYKELGKLLNPKINSSKITPEWTQPQNSTLREGLDVLQDPDNSQRGGYQSVYQSMMINEQGRTVVQNGPGNSKIQKATAGDFDYQMRKSDFGLIIGFSGSPFPGTPKQWDQLFRNIESTRWMWFKRHGMSQVRDNPGYWQFMIPGIGMAPITMFQVFITLFVILIGPVNYLFLKRLGRLNWLIVTVPAGAFIVTSLLMTYAIFSDGFSTRSRERTLTLLDQRTGTSTTWSHQTHYAGLAPSSGFQFPADAAIYEVQTFPGMHSSSQKELDWNEYQNRTKGFFQSRITHQNMLIRPAFTDLNLKFTMNHDAALSVENNLGCKVLLAVAYDHESNPFVIRDLDIDEKVRSLSLTKDEDMDEFNQIFIDSAMGPPPGFDQETLDNIQNNRSRNNIIALQVELDMTIDIYASRLEVEMKQVRSEFFAKKQPHTYLAIVESFPEAPHGVETGKPEKSVQVIRGSW